MFKVIRDFVPKPQFMLLCDRACGNYATAEIPAGPEQNEEAQQALWVQALAQTGWKITLAEQVCPGHVNQDRQAGRMIIIPQAAAFRN